MVCGAAPQQGIANWMVSPRMAYLSAHRTYVRYVLGKEVWPAPREGERVIFPVFVQLGLSLLVINLICSLLNMYMLHLHHPSPNNILQISCFVALCEGYLGIRPNLSL